MDTSKGREKKVCSNGLDYETKMDTMSIYDRYFKIALFKSSNMITLGLGISFVGFSVYHASTNNESKLTLTYLTSRSNLIPNAFKW